MNIATLLMALAGITLTGGGGYLLGLLLGRRARRELTTREAEQAQQIEQLQVALAQRESSTATAEKLREDVRQLIAPVMGAQQASAQQLRVQMQQLVGKVADADDNGDRVEMLRREIHQAIAPMLERDREQKGLRELVLDTLGPLMESQRREQGLKSLSTPRRGREQLPALLDTMARRGGFAAVLLSDDVGLPLAASSGARNADVLAGVSSLILTLADRVAQAGSPTPTAVLVRDNSNQLILHRIFPVADERFLLTAVAKGGEVSTAALDPALAALEDILEKSQAA